MTMVYRRPLGKVVLVCGGRDYTNYPRLKAILDSVGPTAILHGQARGADSLADRYAVAHGVPLLRCPAHWDTYDKAAGGFRNAWMVDLVKVDQVVAFPGGAGTANMVARARLRKIPVLEVEGDSVR